METCLIDQMPEIFRIGLDGIILDARGRTGRYAQEVTAAYRRAVELTAGRYADNSIRRDSPQRDSPESGSLEAGLQELKERIRPLSLGGITHGHFLRGLKD
jgi:putative protease